MKKLFLLCPKRLVVLGISLIIILLHVLLRCSYSIMHFLACYVVSPVNQFCSRISSLFEFSLAELFIALLVLGFLAYAGYAVYIGLKSREILKMIFRITLTAVLEVSLVYAGFCMLWGCYFYDDDFATKSGIDNGPISTDQLETVTAYFA